MVKVRLRKDVYLNQVVPDWRDICYHLMEGFAIDWVRTKEMPSCYKLYFDTCKTQREVIAALHWCQIDTNWNYVKKEATN